MSKISFESESTTVDRYPSRVSEKPQVSARQDPVVYGKASDGPLDEQALARYEENGFLQFDSLLQPFELEKVVAELDRLRDDESLKTTPQSVIEPESGQIRSIFAVHEVSEIMRRLCGHPKLAAIAQQLLGSDAYVHQSRINYKQGFRGEPFFWHSDFETWHVEDGMPAMRAVSCSIALTPNTPYNGPLMLIPGSHHRFVACVGQTPEDHYKQSLRRQELGVPDEESLRRLVQDFGIEAPTGPQGSVTFFECNTMHGSNSNITPYPRSNFFVVYNSVENALVDPFCGLPPRPNFIAQREQLTRVSELARH
ncbi:MAG: ectoine hydroxylase [Orrella sp.]